MSLFKNRKRSGMVLTGVVLSSGVVSAVNQGVVGAVPQSDVVDNALESFAGKGTKNLKLMLAKIIAIAFVSVVILYVCYAIYQYFVPNIKVKEKNSSRDANVNKLEINKKDNGSEGISKSNAKINGEEINNKTATIIIDGMKTKEGKYNKSVIKDDEKKEKEVILEKSKCDELVSRYFDVAGSAYGSKYTSFIVSVAGDIKNEIVKLKYVVDTATFVALGKDGKAVEDVCTDGKNLGFGLRDERNKAYKDEMKKFRKEFFKLANKEELLEKIEKDEENIIEVILEKDGMFEKILRKDLAERIEITDEKSSEYEKFWGALAENFKYVCVVRYDVKTKTFALIGEDGYLVSDEDYFENGIQFCLNNPANVKFMLNMQKFRKSFFEAAGESELLKKIEKEEKDADVVIKESENNDVESGKGETV